MATVFSHAYHKLVAFSEFCSCFDQTPGPLQSSSPPKQCTIGPAGASEPCEAQCPTRVLYVHIEIYSMIYIIHMRIRISPCLMYPACVAA